MTDPHAIAESFFFAATDLDEAALGAAFSEILLHDADDADLYFQYARSESWSLEEGQVKSGSFNIDQGVGARGLGREDRVCLPDDIGRTALMDAAHATRSIARAGGNASAGKANAKASRALYTASDPVSGAEDGEKVRILERLERFARGIDPRVKEVMGRMSGDYEVVMVARADGTRAADVRPLVHIGLTVIAEQNGCREQGSTGGGGRYDYGYHGRSVENHRRTRRARGAHQSGSCLLPPGR